MNSLTEHSRDKIPKRKTPINFLTEHSKEKDFQKKEIDEFSHRIFWRKSFQRKETDEFSHRIFCKKLPKEKRFSHRTFETNKKTNRSWKKLINYLKIFAILNPNERHSSIVSQNILEKKNTRNIKKFQILPTYVLKKKKLKYWKDTPTNSSEEI